ncbi:enoyl-CoA hydratase [Hydrogenophaga sp.]|uniref:enoyl-CoA hydratase n=1 Tax=Hydrogenophaga sp. TaxID=1904254 RepID=UPI002617FCF2|nr:enoyl-CoA hydratase [Hydrogenophaga sp.]MCW5655614.1 enoyl-CoA hydratase [Hydrogenophaga sp.]
MSTASLAVERSPQGWAVITLNRPERLNTLSIQLRQDLQREVAALERDPDIHVLILTAVGKVFTAGLDLDEWNAGPGPAAAAYRHDAVAALRQFQGPVIAAVNGAAITGGLEVVLACDVIIASERARFADTHVRVGLVPGWGGSVRLVRRVGIHRAKELALTARTLDAEEALRLGLVNQVVPHDALLASAQAMACEMLKADPESLKAYKALLDEESMLPLKDALVLERARSEAVNTRERLEDIRARLDRLTGAGRNKPKAG